MSRVEKTVFISYRRDDEAWALAIYNTLTQHGFDVFIDYLGIGSGSFEREILENIGARAHFLVLLTTSALDRVDEPNDWMRREIECAIDLHRNVIPVMLGKFSFDAPEVRSRLTGKLALLTQYNGLPVPAGYFDSAMERLQRQYLSVELDTVLHPPSADARQSATRQQAAADKATAGRDLPPKNLGLSLDGVGNTPDAIHGEEQRRAARGLSDELAESRIIAASPVETPEQSRGAGKADISYGAKRAPKWSGQPSLPADSVAKTPGQPRLDDLTSTATGTTLAAAEVQDEGALVVRRRALKIAALLLFGVIISISVSRLMFSPSDRGDVSNPPSQNRLATRSGSDILESIRPSMVFVVRKNRVANTTSTVGTGFIATGSGIVVTTAHLLNDQSELELLGAVDLESWSRCDCLQRIPDRTLHSSSFSTHQRRAPRSNLAIPKR